MLKKHFNSLGMNRKILSFAMFMALLAQAFTGILACTSILKCSYSVQTQANELGLIAKDNAKIAMQNQNKDILLQIVGQASDSADLFLTQIENQVENLCNFAEDMYSINCENDEIHLKSPMIGYVINSSENSGDSDEILIYENNNLPENLEKEFKILNNISNTAVSMYESSNEIAEIYIVTETGIVYKGNFENTSEVVDSRAAQWYRKAKESAKSGQKIGVWCAQTSSSEGNKSHIIFSKAFFDQSGRMLGVVAAEFYAEKVCEKIAGISGYDDKYVFIFDNDAGKVISPHDESEEFFKGFDNPSESCYRLISSLKSGEYGIFSVLFGDDEYITACAPIKKVSWSVGIADSQTNIDYKSNEIRDNLMREIENSKKKSCSDTSTIIFQFLIIFCSFGIVMYALCKSMVKKVFPDIESIEKDANKFKKFSAELEMAEKIQKSMLPEAGPPNLKRDDLEIYASSVAAEKVGGDFYDFFFIDKNRFALIIADASDKGVPAALYMSAAKNLIKDRLKSTGLLAFSLESVNDNLYEDNDMRMFVTAFVGIFNTKSGKLEFINAGHTPPLFYNQKKGSFDFLGGPHNCALGGIKGKKYSVGEIDVHKNDALILYTDGVTESTNSERKLFSQEKLKELVNNEDIKHLPVENIIKTIRKEVKNYSGEDGYSDDITLLGFRNLGN